MTPTLEQPRTTSLLAELREVIEQREQLAKQDRELSSRRQELERELINFHEQSGLDQIAGAGLTVRFDPAATRCRYDPEKWADIVRWASDSGNLHIIQRRVTDAKVLELVQTGTPLPEGLTIESYTSVSVRRK